MLHDIVPCEVLSRAAGAHREQHGWSSWEVDDDSLSGSPVVHLSFHLQTYDPLIVVASTMDSWVAAEVEEVADMEDDQVVPGLEGEVGDTHQGVRIQTARLWCHSTACSGRRVCEHTRMVQAAFSYISASTHLGAREAVQASLDPVTR
jgi:hypothetical protein